MGAKQRIRPVITMIAPDGKLFEAKWIGDKRSVSKKTALFDFAGVQGTVAQSLRSKSRVYPLTVIFDGDEHDIDAEEFFDALDNQDGNWAINHPKKGFMELRPLDLTEDIQPVKNANGTSFEINWIEPIDPETLLTAAQLAAQQGESLNEFNENCATQFEDNVSLDTEAEITALDQESRNLLDTIQSGLSNLLGASTAAQEQMNNAQLAMESVLDTAILQPLMIAAIIQNAMQTPALVLDSIESRFEYYGNILDQIVGRENEDTDSVARNRSAVKELGATSVIGALSNVCFTGSKPGLGGKAVITTKTNAQKIISDLNEANAKVNDSLDLDQVKYDDQAIQWRFFSQSKSFTSGWSLVLLTSQYLVNVFYGAQIEKRFILKTPKSPIEIVLDKYGELGENDSNLELFLSSNQIKGDDNYLIQPGREVVIYA